MKRFKAGSSIAFALITVATILAGSPPAGAETGTKPGKISGTVVDAATGEVLLGVSIYVEGTETGAISDMDGVFTVKKLDPGTYSLRAQMVGYANLTVTDITVEPGATATVNFQLTEELVDVGEIRVQAKAVNNTEAVMLKHRKASKAVTDAISAEQISKTGSGDAAAAMSKVVGATVDQGSYVAIRGLGDRYSNSQLNGTMLPTPDPEKQAVPMDMIATSLLDNIVVTKTFTPDKQGNFSGGSVDLITKDFPEEQVISLSSSVGYRELSTNNSNFREFDEGHKSIPAAWDSEAARTLGNDWQGFTQNADTANFVKDLSNSFNRSIGDRRKDGPFDGSLAASYGNQFELFGRKLGVNASYGQSYKTSFYDDGIDARYKLVTTEDDYLEIQHYLHDTKSSEEWLKSGLANMVYSLHNNHKIGFTYVRNYAEEETYRYLEGGAPTTFSLLASDTITARLEARVMEYNERNLQSLQFRGEHAFGTGSPVRLNWQASFSEAEQDTPDQRFYNTRVRYALDSTGRILFDQPLEYRIDPTDVDILPTRYFREINEDNDEYRADLTVPVRKNLTARTGFASLTKNRDHLDRRFIYNREGVVPGDPVEYYNSIGYDAYEHPVTGDTLYYSFVNFISESTTPNEAYEGEQEISGYYLMTEWRPWTRLLVVSGARYETTHMFVKNAYDTTAEDYIGGFASGEIDEQDWLPSVNFVLSLTDEMNLRTSYGRTLARPTIREFAPYSSFDFGASGKLAIGNPELKRTLIDNYDLRWEWFDRPGEVIAISGFYKSFTDPIELAIVSTNEDQIQAQNTDKAKLLGVEFEVRKRLDRLHSLLRNFDISGNLTLVDSRVDIPADELVQQRAYDPGTDDTRQMFGQAPYVVNLGLGFSDYDLGTSINVHYNAVGKKLAFNAPGGTPDVYEKARSIFDVVASQRLWRGLKVKFSAKNVFDAKAEEIYEFLGEEYTYTSHSIGRSLSAGISYTIE